MQQRFEEGSLSETESSVTVSEDIYRLETKFPLIWGRFPYLITSNELLDEFMDEYRERRRRNLDHPLRSGDKITLRKRSPFNFLKDAVYRVNTGPKSSSSPLPYTDSGTTRPRLKELDSQQAGGIQLVLLSTLNQDPANRQSQVWNVQTSGGGRVIIKIFQSCCDGSPYLDENMGR